MRIGAEQGLLSSMTSGSEEAIERVRPLIESYSRKLHRVGSNPRQKQMRRNL